MASPSSKSKASSPNHQDGQVLPFPSPNVREPTPFEDPILLKQSPVWSRLLLWSLLSVTTFTIAWVCLAKIDQVVVAQGELEPQGTVEELQAAANGTVAKVRVENGQSVRKGESLIVFETESLEAEREALKEQYTLLSNETAFYRSQLLGDSTAPPASTAKISTDVLFLVRDRNNLLSEIRLLRSQLSGRGEGLSLDQQARVQSAQASLGAQVQVDQLAVAQLHSQLSQTQVQLGNAQTDLQLETDKLRRYTFLEKEGAVAKVATIEQQQKVNAAQTQVEVLSKEKQRLQEAIRQGQATVDTTVLGSQHQLREQLAQAQQRIEEIDARLGKLIVDNEQRLAQLESEIEQTETLLVDHELVAPVAGVVFDLVADEGLVTNRSEVLLKVVPADALVAEVFIAADDIGYVAPEMAVDVRLEAFSSSDGAKVNGEIIWIGDDAIAPDELNPYHRYPAKVQLFEQVVEVKGDLKPLKPGMRVSASIKERKRRVIAVFADFLTDRWESLKKMR